MAHDRVDVVVQQAGFEQGAHEVGDATGRVEVVHVCGAVGVDLRDRRHDRRQVREVVPGQGDTRGPRDGDQVHGVVRRPAAGEQGDTGVDDGLLVDDLPDRERLAGGREVGQLGDSGTGGASETLAQGRSGVHERRPGKVQAEDLHDQLVRVGRAVERAGPGRVVRRGLGLEQLLAADLALGVQLADAGLLAVREPGGHRAGGHEHRRQVSEGQRPDQEAGDDLVADAEHQRAVEHVVGERDGGGHRDDVATVERQLHAVATLGDAVAHGGYAARELGDAAGPDDRLLEHLRVGLEGLVCRQHVVVGRHDRDVGLGPAAQLDLLGGLRRGEPVGQVGAGELAAGRALVGGSLDPGEVRRPGRGAALDDAPGDGLEFGVGHESDSCQERPSRSSRVAAAVGPLVPAG